MSTSSQNHVFQGVISMKWSNSVLSVLSIAVIGLLTLGLTSTPAFADSPGSPAITTFTVSETVTAYCTVTAGAMQFPDYTAAAVSNTSSIIKVTCSTGAPYTLGLNQGATSGATVTTRQMLNGLSALNYGLYTDTGHNTNFATLASTSGTGAEQDTTVYGQVPASQLVPTGSYSDTITVTITY